MFIPLQSGNSAPMSLTPKQMIRTSQIICGALMTGVVVFAGIAVTRPAPPMPNLLITYIAAGFSAFAIAIRFVVPAFVARNEVAMLKGTQPDSLDTRLYAVFQTKMIIGLAVLEGAAFMNILGYMMGRQWWSLAIVGVLLLLMAMMFPTLGRFESWADDIKRSWQNEF